MPTESFVLGTSKLGKAKLSGENVIQTESALFNVTKFDDCKLSRDSIYSELFDQLEILKSKPNNKQDALISETALKNMIPLVTDDKNLSEVHSSHGGIRFSLKQFLSKFANCS